MAISWWYKARGTQLWAGFFRDWEAWRKMTPESPKRKAPPLLSDPISGRKVVLAPGRRRRPGNGNAGIAAATAEELERCPFCEGREDKTPPELLALGGTAARAPDSPGWKVRVVPNLYSAFERQQVVIHSPRHVRSVTELPPGQLALVVEAWAEVAERAWREGFDHLQVFVNEGTAAGASLAHSHSQLVWLDHAPPEVALEQPQLSSDNCALCALLAHLNPKLVLDERKVGKSILTLAVSPSGRAPYELLVAPSDHLGDAFGATEELAAAFALAAERSRRPFAIQHLAAQFPGRWALAPGTHTAP